ncbi:hypothetical protein ACFYV7_19290 [Nocardia suismassiliense]|uniref:Secreted protein n=1 Tax=Nocardia suismassiliense TaxID=2077092 RepID=A0ABW6QWG2_9NOCA
MAHAKKLRALVVPAARCLVLVRQRTVLSGLGFGLLVQLGCAMERQVRAGRAVHCLVLVRQQMVLSGLEFGLLVQLGCAMERRAPAGRAAR